MTNSAGALRMRLYRHRRRKKLRCLTIQIRETKIDALIQKGLLRWDMRHDRIAVRNALHSFLDQTLSKMV